MVTGMNSQFFDNPILNSPYEYPDRHWELDDDGQPTQRGTAFPVVARRDAQPTDQGE